MDAALPESLTGWPVCRGCGRDLCDLSPMWSCPECGTTPHSVSIREGYLTTDRPCLQCGYNLKGLEVCGRCPECGGEILRSLQGNLLIYSSAAFARKLVLGSTLILWGLVLFCLSLIGFFLSGASRSPASPGWLRIFPTIMTVLPCVGSICSLAGWWFISEPDPGLMGQDRMTSARRILRVAVVLSAAAYSIEMLTHMSSAGLSLQGLLLARGPRTTNAFVQLAKLAILTNTFVWPVKTLASLQYIRAIALRVPSEPQARRALALIRFALAGAALMVACIIGSLVLNLSGIRLSDLTPVLSLPMCGAAVGILAWSCTYAALIGGLRTDLSRISRRLAERDARSGATSVRFDTTS